MSADLQTWRDIVLRHIDDEMTANLFIEGVLTEVAHFELLKKKFEGVANNRTLTKFTKIEKHLTKAMKAVEGVSKGERWLFSTWISNIVNMSGRQETDKPNFSDVHNRFDEVSDSLGSWIAIIRSINQMLRKSDQFKGKAQLSSILQYHLAYRIRLLYKELFELPSLPTAQDADFDVIFESLFTELDYDINMSRVYKKSTPKIS